MKIIILILLFFSNVYSQSEPRFNIDFPWGFHSNRFEMDFWVANKIPDTMWTYRFEVIDSLKPKLRYFDTTITIPKIIIKRKPR